MTTKNDALIKSLKFEREGYLRRGLMNRVAAVDEVLAGLGVRELASVEPPAERAVAPKGKKRKQNEVK